MASVSVSATNESTRASFTLGGGRVNGETIDGNPDGTTPTSAKPLPDRSNFSFETIPSTIARKGPSEPNSVDGIELGRLSIEWSGSRFKATKNAKVNAENAAVNE